MKEKVIELLNIIDLEARGDAKLIAKDLRGKKLMREVQKTERQILV